MPLIESYLPLEASLSELLSILILQAPTEWHRILNGFSNPKFKCHHNRSQNKGSDEVLQYLVICTNSYPSWGFFPCDKHLIKSNLRRKGLFVSLKLPDHTPPLTEVGTETQGKNLGTRTEAESWRKAIYWFAQSVPLYNSETPSQGWHYPPPQWAGTVYINHLLSIINQ